MTTRHRRTLIVAGALLAAFICGIIWTSSSPSEPTYGGKRLSAWVDELCALDYFKRADPGTPQVQAVRAIGTNAIPWLLKAFRPGGAAWQWKLNQLLNKQSMIRYRFPDPNVRLTRGTVGFWALGEMAEPAIPTLLTLVEAYPGYVPGALAGIGRPAKSALQQCLTNMKLYTNSLGSYAIIRGTRSMTSSTPPATDRFRRQTLRFFFRQSKLGRGNRQTDRRKARRLGSLVITTN
jgi:hypothetical protein